MASSHTEPLKQGRPARVSRPRSLAELAPDEAHLLKISRLFFEGLGMPASEAWIAAFVHAEMALANCGGARLAYGVLAAVQGLRSVRPLAFRYMRAGCPQCSWRLTDDERHFVLAYRALRDGIHRDAQRHLTILTFSDGHGILASALELLGKDLAPLAIPTTGWLRACGGQP